MRLLAVFALIALSGSADAQNRRQFVLYQTTELENSREALTVQPRTDGEVNIDFVYAAVHSSVRLEFFLVIDGSPATATPATPTPVGYSRSAARVAAFSGSDSEGGAVVGRRSLRPGETMVFDLAGFAIPRSAGSDRNLSIRSASNRRGTVTIALVWVER